MTIFARIMSVLLFIPALFGLYMNDAKDTEEAYLERVESVGYENTIETAIPQTEIYDMIVGHYKAALPEGKTEKKAIVIGYDGCRADVVSLAGGKYSGITTMLNDGASINLGYCGGVNYPDGENTQATSTAPGWCSLLTGVWAEKNGVFGNGQPKNLEYKTLMTELVEDGTIDSASFITKWGGHFSNDDSTYINEKEYCEDKGLAVSFNKTSGNEGSMIKAKNELSKADCPDFTIAIYENTDSNGHNLGFSFNNPYYKAGFDHCEKFAFDTIRTIKNRDTFETEDWLIIITSDHGGFGTGHGGPTIQERMIFIVANKY
ncbi:MAG: alkaline phosphatase family protein [Clostridia bacterium]|nr:alkaline phosphatase family protein [Clostridia bacterium]